MRGGFVMNIAKYTFISPYPSPIQVGKLDPSSVKESDTQTADKTKEITSFSSQKQRLQELEIMDTSVKGSDKPATPVSFSLDTYA